MVGLTDFTIESFTEENVKDIYQFVQKYNKFYDIPFNYFVRATLEDPDYNDSLNIILKDRETEEIIAVFLSTIRFIDNLKKCFIKVFIIQENLKRQGLGSAILNEILNKLRSKTVPIISYGASAPVYWEPGVDLRHTDLFFFLKAHKFRVKGLRYNLTVNLEEFQLSPKNSIGSVKLMRAETKDLNELYYLIKNNFPSQAWPEEVKASFDFDPPMTYIAKNNNDRIIGWATHSNFYPGSFGPTGVLTSYQGQGIGKQLLIWCLEDIKSKGLKQCSIMWVTGDTRKFYSKAVSAYISPVYVVLEKKIQ